jgi:hypothetical protein
MTGTDTEREVRHRALMAVATAVRDAGGTDKLLGTAVDRWPRMNGFTIADVLDTTGTYDMLADEAAPFFEANGDQLPSIPAVGFAVCACILLGGELTVVRVLQLAHKAGFGPRAAGYADAMAARPSTEASWPAALRLRYHRGFHAGQLEQLSAAERAARTLDWVPAPQGGQVAHGDTFTYLVVARTGPELVAGCTVLLTRWTADLDPAGLDAMAEAITNLIEVSTADLGREYAEDFEAGRDVGALGQAWRYTDTRGLAVTDAERAELGGSRE